MRGIKYDLAAAQPEKIAKAVLSGAVQIDEIPRSNRRQVERIVREAEAKAAEAAKASTTPSMDMKKSELQELATGLGLEFTDTNTKAELLAMIEEAQNAGNE